MTEVNGGERANLCSLGFCQGLILPWFFQESENSPDNWILFLQVHSRSPSKIRELTETH